jgi:hypothetical protein
MELELIKKSPEKWALYVKEEIGEFTEDGLKEILNKRLQK